MIDWIKNYFENKIQLVKLELITVFANVASNLVSYFLILIFALIILLMLSLSMAFWLSEILVSQAMGFAIVGGGYAIILILYLLFSRKAIESKVKDIVVNSALDSDESIDQELD